MKIITILNKQIPRGNWDVRIIVEQCGRRIESETFHGEAGQTPESCLRNSLDQFGLEHKIHPCYPDEVFVFGEDNSENPGLARELRIMLSL